MRRAAVLIVFEETREPVRLFLVSDPEITEMSGRWHGKFINGDEMTPELETLWTLVTGADGYTIDERLVEIIADEPFVGHTYDITVISTGICT